MNEITNQLWIGDIDDVQSGNTSRFDHVVGVCQDTASENVGCRYSHFNMADGDESGHVPGDSSYELFEQAADTVLTSIAAGNTVLVHCHRGQSRSAMICAAVLAVTEDLPFLEARRRIKDSHPSDGVIDHARQYIHQKE